MTASIRILTTSTIDSNPSILLCSPNGSKTLVNCGEGCQRTFLESTLHPGGVRMKARSVDRVCLTHVGYSASGGLPGFLLTVADASVVVSSVVVEDVRGGGVTKTKGGRGSISPSRGSNGNGNGSRSSPSTPPPSSSSTNAKNGKKRDNSQQTNTSGGGIHIVGPIGTQSFIHSLRNFMRRDRFTIKVSEGSYTTPPPPITATTITEGGGSGQSKKKRKKNGGSSGASGTEPPGDGGIFNVTAIPLTQTIPILQPPPNNNNNNEQQTTQTSTTTATTMTRNIASYLFITNPIPGKFQIKKARELGIPPGPMYAQLVKGMDVTFRRPIRRANGEEGHGTDGIVKDEEEEEVVVHSHQVLEGGSDGVAVLYVYCPDDSVLDQLSSDHNEVVKVLDRFRVMTPSQPSATSTTTTTTTTTTTATQSPDTTILLEVMIHCTPADLIATTKYRRWMDGFGPTVRHIHIRPATSIVGVGSGTNMAVMDGDGGGKEDRSPFRSAMMGAMGRSLLHPGIYSNPLLVRKDEDDDAGSSSPANSRKDGSSSSSLPPSIDEAVDSSSSGGNMDLISARQGMEYVLIPLSKKGLILSGRANSTTATTTTTDATSSNKNNENNKNNSNTANPITDNTDITTPNDDDDKTSTNPVVVLRKGERRKCHDRGISKQSYDLVYELAHESGAVRAARSIIDSHNSSSSSSSSSTNTPLLDSSSSSPPPPLDDTHDVNVNNNMDDDNNSIPMSTTTPTVCHSNCDNGLIPTSVDDDCIPAASSSIKQQQSPLRPSTSTITRIASSSSTKINGGSNGNTTSNSSTNNYKAELLFTGTGSAVPCKHRNVTGIYLRMATNDNNAMLLDVGEGTVGQLLRVWRSGEVKKRMRGIKCVFVSHPHAYHHLGIVRFLTERNAILYNDGEEEMEEENDDRILLIAPRGLLNFLSDYQKTDPTISHGYLPIDCETLLHTTNYNNKPHRIADLARSRLASTLGITHMVTVPVAHCRNSYGVLIETSGSGSGSATSFGRVVYSGDCRPSERLVDVANRRRQQLQQRNNDNTNDDGGVDLLIHEATFEDGMESEAILKRHSTVGEALRVGRDMDVKVVMLTHFSQRYPKIPLLGDAVGGVVDGNGDRSCNPVVVVAFDFMRVEPGNLHLASKLTPALRLLYPPEQVEDGDTNTAIMEGQDGMDLSDGGGIGGKLSSSSHKKKTAKEIMSEPGAFAIPFSCDTN